MIQIGEEYIENKDGEIIHLDCVYGVRDLLDWFGENINVIEEWIIEYLEDEWNGKYYYKRRFYKHNGRH